MQEAAVLPLPTWQNFYVIIGSAAATLTGLMFVAITLIARMRDRMRRLKHSPRQRSCIFAPRSSSRRFSARRGRRSGMLAFCSASLVSEG